jgi:glyoxylase-like metal-dependent hydrolase (beta-lactamase superfamily II)
MTADRPDPPGIVRIRAPNPSPLTLDGTNTYLAGGWVVDPGPADIAHLGKVLSAAGGAIEGIVLTHDHFDHSEGAQPLARMAGGVPVVRPAGGESAGPFEAIATPGHAPDHVCLLLDSKDSASVRNPSRDSKDSASVRNPSPGRACFTGDTVLGQGSVFIQPGEGSLSAYLDSLRRLRKLDLEVLCPGHGPYVHDPDAKLAEYIEHRLERERTLLHALDAGARTEDELLDRAWADAPGDLRPAAALTLRAHLEKLAEEGRLPEGVEGA